MTWDAQYQGGHYRKYPNEMLVSWIARTYKGTPYEDRKRLLAVECGCGAGANLVMLANEGFAVLGLDSAEEAVALCKARGVPAMYQDVRRMDLATGRASLVVDVTCLQHLTTSDHLLAVQEAHRILKPGGRLFSYRLGIGTSFEALFPGNPGIWAATKNDLREQLGTAGFSRIGILSHDREYPQARWARYLCVEATA